MREDGSLLDVSLTVSPLRDAAGRIIGASKIARDITQRKRAEETLRPEHGSSAPQRGLSGGSTKAEPHWHLGLRWDTDDCL
jgi:hypothetical protein